MKKSTIPKEKNNRVKDRKEMKKMRIINEVDHGHIK